MELYLSEAISYVRAKSVNLEKQILGI